VAAERLRRRSAGDPEQQDKPRTDSKLPVRTPSVVSRITCDRHGDWQPGFGGVTPREKFGRDLPPTRPKEREGIVNGYMGRLTSRTIQNRRCNGLIHYRSLKMAVVGTESSVTGMKQSHAARPYAPWTAACEAALVFACILLYIWRWQSTHPLVWIPLLGVIILSQILHHESPRAMGLTFAELRPSAKIILPLAVAIYIPVVGLALGTHRLSLSWPAASIPNRFAGYGIWCCFQQYLMQCYFHRRVMRVVRKPHWSSALVAIMFGVAHIPNAVLMAATVAGGLILAEVYARHPNIWALALAQAIGGLLIAALVPAPIIHNMRVGPGYYTYRPR
jgi:hypothetical protein